MKYFIVGLLLASQINAAEPTMMDVWPKTPPGETKKLPPEQDINKETDALVGGRKIIKLTNVSKPTLAIYRPDPAKDTGASVIICPGGGHSILAYDHEGTEVADFLTKHGVTGIVLKYRVPFRDPEKRYGAAVQDAQRAIRLVRHNAKDWDLDPNRIGILGFSAGGQTAGLAALWHDQDQYDTIDEIDKVSARPNFAALIYPAYLIKPSGELQDDIKVKENTPPMFLAHSFDDRVDCRNSVQLALELKKQKIPVELHLYATGGHGYGMRNTGHPCHSWPDRFIEWMQAQKWLAAKVPK